MWELAFVTELLRNRTWKEKERTDGIYLEPFIFTDLTSKTNFSFAFSLPNDLTITVNCLALNHSKCVVP